MKNIVDYDKLAQLIVANWAEILNRTELLKRVLEDTRDAELKIVPNDNQISSPQTKVSVTRCSSLNNGKFEIWIEFTIMREEGIAIGTHTYEFTFEGKLDLKYTHGVIFDHKV